LWLGTHRIDGLSGAALPRPRRRRQLHAAAVDDGYVIVSDQGDRYEPLAVWLRD
jgi:hypothetical protein